VRVIGEKREAYQASSGAVGFHGELGRKEKTLTEEIDPRNGNDVRGAHGAGGALDLELGEKKAGIRMYRKR